MLNTYLAKRKISCYALAKITNIPYSTLNKIVRGERKIDDCSVNVLIKLANGIGLSLEETISICNERDLLPESLKQYFWDTTFEELDLVKNKNYIISRLLDYGGFEGWKFVYHNYDREEIKDTALNSRWMSQKLANYFLVTFDLKKDQMKFYKYGNQNRR